jgi:hypothetical protein
VEEHGVHALEQDDDDVLVVVLQPQFFLVEVVELQLQFLVVVVVLQPQFFLVVVELQLQFFLVEEVVVQQPQFELELGLDLLLQL